MGFLDVAGVDIFSINEKKCEMNVQAVFEIAREMSPCIIFFDLIDAICGAYANERESIRRVKLQLMKEMIEIRLKGSGILVIGATYHPDLLDEMILPLFPKRVDAPTATETERKLIIKQKLEEYQLVHSVSFSDLSKIAMWTEGLA